MRQLTIRALVGKPDVRNIACEIVLDPSNCRAIVSFGQPALDLVGGQLGPASGQVLLTLRDVVLPARELAKLAEVQREIDRLASSLAKEKFDSELDSISNQSST